VSPEIKKISLLTILALLSVSSVFAVSIYYSLYYPQTVTVQKMYGLEVYINGEFWKNETTIDWGNVTYGNCYKTLDVKNTGNVPVKVILVIGTLPAADWSLSWSSNETRAEPNSWVNGTMTLTVPLSAANVTYTWDSWVQAIEP
jgi:hypothetical protein